ncbi:Hypothetical protein PHPALM_36591 [Phytophthora palmivora]|uniref:PiggyBac transposable element-derived protein domain-containing protein n=1 Tax=Phytophthora palmivora TaxID=4796 RepID=A0A2P4WZJ9_9STRA|nr:Hypothetical protein PHPALM_36591 [Phytophthora palmivora]
MVNLDRLALQLWRKIAAESNTLRDQSINEVAEKMRERAQERRAVKPSTVVLTVEGYKMRLKSTPFSLMNSTLEPRRESLSRHWVTKAEGALSRGTFGQFMSRDRFEDIVRYIHFNNNDIQRDSGDRAFKIRPVIQALQKTFFRGFRLGSRISFDEGMVPMRHRRNPMRQFMPMKPNKWGTKFYLTCCADTAYCCQESYRGTPGSGCSKADMHRQLLHVGTSVA